MLPKVIGHRGAAALAPENTLAGFRKAAELGCTWVEFDIRLTADDQLAVIHDSTVDRTTTGTGRVRDMTLEQLSALDAGAPFGPAFAGEPVPSLSDAVSALDRLGLAANIEIKCDVGDSAAAADAAVRLLEQDWSRDAPPLVSSFDPVCLAAVRQRSATLPLGVLVRTLDDDWHGLVDRLGAATLHVGDRGLSEDQLQKPARERIDIGVYTVNEAARARQLYAWGVAGVFTDRPDTVRPDTVRPDIV